MEGNRKNKIALIFRYAAVVLIAVLAVVFVLIITAPAEHNVVPDESSTEITESGTEVIGPTASAMDILKINALIESYFTAKNAADADMLNRIVLSDRRYNTKDLLQETNIIGHYDNFRMYVLPSEEELYDVVYVTYDIYFKGLNIGAPALNRFVVRRQADDEFVIYSRFISTEFDEWLETTEKSQQIVMLKRQVNEELNQACENNADLKNLMEFMQNAALEPEEVLTSATETETEEETGTETDEETGDETEEDSESDEGDEDETHDGSDAPPAENEVQNP
ncbi:MAG: hypothetical protein IK088_09980 [Lachnospiraceae bacterium]|nr:hypothetical protein [Lachnospiraceae bacterium]